MATSPKPKKPKVNNRTRGFNFEREVVNAAKERGLSAQRAWGSDGRSLGLPAGVDAVVAGRAIQCKRTRKLPGYLDFPEGADVVVVREDRGRALVLMPLAQYLDMLVVLSHPR
jgi:Holliday junction resolvase